MNLVKTLVAYLVARLSEASTWASLTAYLGAQFGLHLNPDFDSPLAQLVVAAAALAGVLIKEGWQAKENIAANAAANLKSSAGSGDRT